MTIILGCGLATIRGQQLYVLQLLIDQIWYPKQTTCNSYMTDARVYIMYISGKEQVPVEVPRG